VGFAPGEVDKASKRDQGEAAMVRCKGALRSVAALLISVMTSVGHAQSDGPLAARKVNTLKDVFEKLLSCWRPPPASAANPMDITVIVSFNRTGQILGHPRITYESAQASDADRLAYRIAVMETLQRCAPLPFTETMGGAVAGHPFAVEFRKPPQREKRAWLSPKTL
jgi:hypothetical protein